MVWDLQIYRFQAKKIYIKVPVDTRSLMLCSKSCFCYLIRKFAFLWEKIIIHKQQCARMCMAVACKPGRQDSAISKASLHASHPPMCLKMPCKCTMIDQCNGSLCKKCKALFLLWFCFIFFNSKLSLVFHYVNLPKGEVLMTFCVSTLTL